MLLQSGVIRPEFESSDKSRWRHPWRTHTGKHIEPHLVEHHLLIHVHATVIVMVKAMGMALMHESASASARS
jgi:hypothetical protein